MRSYCVPLCFILLYVVVYTLFNFSIFDNFCILLVSSAAIISITRTQRSFIEYIHWPWIQSGISCLVRLGDGYVEQIRPTRLTSQTVSQKMNKSTKELHCCTPCSRTYLHRLFAPTMNTYCCVHQLQRLVAHALCTSGRTCVCTRMHRCIVCTGA